MSLVCSAMLGHLTGPRGREATGYMGVPLWLPEELWPGLPQKPPQQSTSLFSWQLFPVPSTVDIAAVLIPFLCLWWSSTIKRIKYRHYLMVSVIPVTLLPCSSRWPSWSSSCFSKFPGPVTPQDIDVSCFLLLERSCFQSSSGSFFLIF